MASLINCKPVTSWTSEEYAGDMPGSIGVGYLEGQTIFEGVDVYNPDIPANGFGVAFWLVIEALPGYYITRDMINIGGISPAWNGEWDDVGTVLSFGQEVLNQYPDIDSIIIYNDVGGNYDAVGDCTNRVIVEVVLNVDFVMPANNHTISIDFGGTAINCTASEENLAYNTIETKLIVSNMDGINDVGGASLFVAQYYDDESYASSNFNLQNTTEYINEDFESIDLCYHPVYDWNGGFLNAIDNPFYTMNFSGEAITNNCWNNYQPTCYTIYNSLINNIIPAGLGSIYSAENYFPSTCGQLLFPDGMLVSPSSGVGGVLFDQQPMFGDCQEFFECGQVYTGIGNYCEEASRARYDFKIDTYENSTRYLSQFDYPTIEPGGPMIPSSLSWYLSLGNGSDFELDSDISYDVWKIITVIGEHTVALDANIFDAAGLYDGTTTCTLNTTPITTNTNESQVCESYLVSDSTENNSDLDFENKTITQIDSKTVKLTIPFKSNLSIPRFTPADLTDTFTASKVKRTNKIFLNIYPIE